MGKIINKYPKGVSEKEYEYIKKETKNLLSENKIIETLKSENSSSFMYRINKLKEALETNRLNKTDLMMIRFFYGKEKFKNIKFETTGKIYFQANDVVTNMIEKRINDSFFMKRWLNINENKDEIEIKDWQRDINDLLDIVLFIKKKGNLKEFEIELTYEEKGFNKIKNINDKLFYLKDETIIQEVREIDGLLNSLEFNENDNIHILIEGKKFPMIPYYMKTNNRNKDGKYINETPNIIKEGKICGTSCDMCLNRMKKATEGGCKVCVPKNIK